MRFWTDYWTIILVGFLLLIAVPDFIAMSEGHRDNLGDSFTFTHFLVTRVGLSIIGAFIGYLIAHFLIVHRNG